MKRVAVIVRSSAPDRVAEALRAAVGLGLRGDRIDVVLAPGARPALADPQVTRAAATLIALGHEVHGYERPGAGGSPTGPTNDPVDGPAPNPADGPPAPSLPPPTARAIGQVIGEAIRRADAVEVWT